MISGRRRVFEELSLKFQLSNMAQKGRNIKQITKGSENLESFPKKKGRHLRLLNSEIQRFHYFDTIFFFSFSVCLFNQTADCLILYRFIVRRCYCWADLDFGGWWERCVIYTNLLIRASSCIIGGRGKVCSFSINLIIRDYWEPAFGSRSWTMSTMYEELMRHWSQAVSSGRQWNDSSFKGSLKVSKHNSHCSLASATNLARYCGRPI